MDKVIISSLSAEDLERLSYMASYLLQLVNKMCVSTQNKVLRDISRCFTEDSDMPEREQLFSFLTFKKISKYGK